MLNLKRLLTKLCEKVTTKNADITTSYRTGAIHFRKMGDIVVCFSSNDFITLDSRTFVNIGTIPEGFRPNAYSITVAIQNNTRVITLTFLPSGEIRAYNYSTSAITTNDNGAFFAVWSTV